MMARAVANSVRWFNTQPILDDPARFTAAYWLQVDEPGAWLLRAHFCYLIFGFPNSRLPEF